MAQPIAQRQTASILAGMVGNVLEHYDSALYGLLVPFLAPLFFTPLPYLTGLMIGYGIQLLGIVMRPLGAVTFGYLGDRYGRRALFSLAVMGMAFATFLIGLLPTYEMVGLFSPISLAICRGLQSFFIAGAARGGALFVLEHAPQSRRGFLGALYESSTLLGILLASGLVMGLSWLDGVERYWRCCFFLGASAGLVGLWVYRFGVETADYQTLSKDRKSLIQSFFKNWKALIAVALVVGLSYTTYVVPFTLMNGFLPLISPVSHSQALEGHTWLLFLDMALLPLFGLLAQRIAPERLMRLAAWGILVVALPLFCLLLNPSLLHVTIVRVSIVLLGVLFAAPLNQWMLTLVPVNERYFVTAVGTAIGSQLIGIPALTVSLFLYHQTGWVIAPAFYLILCALGALFALSKRLGR